MTAERRKYRIEVKAQFEVTAESFEDACDMAVDQALEMDGTEWATVDLGQIEATQ